MKWEGNKRNVKEERS